MQHENKTFYQQTSLNKYINVANLCQKSIRRGGGGRVWAAAPRATMTQQLRSVFKGKAAGRGKEETNVYCC